LWIPQRETGKGRHWEIPIFGIVKRGGPVYTHILPNATEKTLLPIIGEKEKDTPFWGKQKVTEEAAGYQ